MKTIWIILGVLVLIIIGIFVVKSVHNDAQNPESSDQTDQENGVIVDNSQEITGNGVVVEVNNNDIAFDGPYKITIESDGGERTLIAIPSMGLPMCEAYKKGAIKDPSTIIVGTRLEVRGARMDDGSIVPCTSATHYLK